MTNATNQLAHLFDNNRRWAAYIAKRDPDFFQTLARQQSPDYFWIGCSDSRVPANEILGLMPGEVFVHRNVANVVVHSDLNCLSAMQFAVDVIKVKHVMVVGHLGCGGVRCALHGERHGLVDNWIRHVQDVALKHEILLATLPEEARLSALSALNVVEQVINMSQTTIVQDAWARGQPVSLHGWIYSIEDGLLRDLGMNVSSMAELSACYARAIQQVKATGGVIAQLP